MSQPLTYQTSKQTILKRMLRVAIQLTGAKKTELLDPFVTLLTESLANEVHNISNEIDAVEKRMLESVSEILCPDISLWAHPAHCILHALPQEGTLLLTKETPFIVKNNKRSLHDNQKLIFHPVCDTPIRKADIQYIVYNGLCCGVDMGLNKTLLFRSHNREASMTKSYWIGIELDESIQEIENLSFYIDLTGVSNKDELLNLLRFSTWKLNTKSLNLYKGIHTVNMSAKNQTIKLLDSLSPADEMNNAILNLYDRHFITVENKIQVDAEKKLYPEEFIDYFPIELLQDFINPILWIEIELPQKITPILAESLTVSINAFPVANKYLCSKSQEVNEIIQAIPLETINHQSFLSVESVMDSKGREYYPLPFADTNTTQYHTYSLHRGGYERYNKRDAREYMSILLNLLTNQSSLEGEQQDEDKREESSHQVQDLLKQMKKIFSEFKEKYEIQYYILIDQIEGKDVFFLNYWLTDCEKANGLKRGTYFDLDNEKYFPVDAASVFALSETIGGKSAPDFTERQNLRMQSLSKQKMLITNEDITDFCKKALNDIIHKVEVRPGCIHEGTSGDFLRTTDVFLTPTQNTETLFDNKDLLLVKSLLEKNSPEAFNYRVFIDNN